METTAMESPKMHSLVGTKTALPCAGWQTTPSHVRQYRVENGTLRKSGSTFRHDTVFAPKQCLYPEVTTGMESPKMHSSSRDGTYLGLYTLVYVRKQKFEEIRVYLSAGFRVCTKAMSITKGVYRNGESKNVFLYSVQKAHLPVRDGKLSRLM